MSGIKVGMANMLDTDRVRYLLEARTSLGNAEKKYECYMKSSNEQRKHLHHMPRYVHAFANIPISANDGVPRTRVSNKSEYAGEWIHQVVCASQINKGTKRKF